MNVFNKSFCLVELNRVYNRGFHITMINSNTIENAVLNPVEVNRINT